MKSIYGVMSMVVAMGFASGCTLDTGAGDSTGRSAVGTEEAIRHGRPGFEILGPEGKIRGKTIEQWSTEWWQWAQRIPASAHPLIDDTGEFCHEGQKGPIFNLGGTFGGAATRTCTISHAKPVFFPLITTSGDNCGVPPEFQLSDADIIAFLENFDESVTTLELDVDGTVIGDDKAELAPFLIDVTKFSYFVPENDSLYDVVFGLDFAGVCKPSWNSGYYVMLSLEPGEHTLHFAGALDNGFALEATYHLNVK